jgi:hypothetical protein
VGRDILPDLLELRRADLASRQPDGRIPSDWENVERRIREFERAEAAAPSARLSIGGREIREVLGIPEGPEVGRWLRRAQRRILERPEENQRERLLAWLRKAGQAGAD